MGFSLCATAVNYLRWMDARKLDDLHDDKEMMDLVERLIEHKNLGQRGGDAPPPDESVVDAVPANAVAPAPVAEEAPAPVGLSDEPSGAAAEQPVLPMVAADPPPAPLDAAAPRQ